MKETATEQVKEAPKTESNILRFLPRADFEVKVGFPHIYPDTIKNPFIFFMRVQLNKDAQAAQEKFLGMPDDEQTPSEYYLYNIEMISILSTKAPEGFPDFPVVSESTADRIRAYFHRENPDEAAGMALILQAVMNRYWRSIQSPDYL